MNPTAAAAAAAAAAALGVLCLPALQPAGRT